MLGLDALPRPLAVVFTIFVGSTNSPLVLSNYNLRRACICRTPVPWRSGLHEGVPGSASAAENNVSNEEIPVAGDQAIEAESRLTMVKNPRLMGRLVSKTTYRPVCCPNEPIEPVMIS